LGARVRLPRSRHRGRHPGGLPRGAPQAVVFQRRQSTCLALPDCLAHGSRPSAPRLVSPLLSRRPRGDAAVGRQPSSFSVRASRHAAKATAGVRDRPRDERKVARGLRAVRDRGLFRRGNRRARRHPRRYGLYSPASGAKRILRALGRAEGGGLMRRICDQPSADRETAEVAELLSCARVDDPSVAVKQRVWRGMAEPSRRAGRVLLLRPAFLLLALLIAGVATAGTLLLIRHFRDQSSVQPSQESPAHEQPAAQKQPARQEQPAPQQQPSSTLAVDSPTSIPTVHTRTSRPDGLRSAHVRVKPAATRSERLASETVVPTPNAPAPPVAAKRDETVSSSEIVRLLAPSKTAATAPQKPSPPEAELVLEATLALRELHDPRRSLVFLR